jgi:spore coat protein CotF
MPDMTEQDLLTDLLNQEKQMISSYAMYIQEATCPSLRKVLMSQLSQTCQDEYQVFDQMRQKGYYTPKDAADKDVQTAKNTLKNMKQTELR